MAQTSASASYAVAAPKAHHGLVGPNANLNPQLIRPLDVHVSGSPVDSAYISVQHRGYWFYVGDKNIESGRALGLLTSLARLSISAGSAQNAPLLTLPVSR